MAGSFLLITTTLVVVNVFLRYVMKTGLYWSEEVATGCFVWSVFIGSAACYKRKTHVGVDIVVNKLSRIPQNIVKIVVDVILIILTGYMAYVSYVYVSLSGGKMTPVLGVPSTYISVSMLICFVLCTIYSILFFVQDCRAVAAYGTVKGRGDE